MDILIRRANGNDCQLIADIGRVAVDESHGASCSVADMELFLSTHYNEGAIMNELSDPANIYHVLFYGEKPVGFSKIILNMPHANISRSNVTKLDRIYLLSSFYDLKLGFHLLSHNIAFSKENGQYGMWLFTWTGNERAVNFYKKTGFSIIGDHKFKVSDTHYNPNHHMFRLARVFRRMTRVPIGASVCACTITEDSLPTAGIDHAIYFSTIFETSKLFTSKYTCLPYRLMKYPPIIFQHFLNYSKSFTVNNFIIKMALECW